MKKNLRQIITLSAMVALLISACSESSDSTGAAENDTVEINESSSSVDSSSSTEAKNTAVSKDEKESSSSTAVEESAASSFNETNESSSGITASSSSTEIAFSSSSETTEATSSETATGTSSSSEKTSSSAIISSSSVAELSETCKALRTTQNEFIPLENIFECVQPNEKVAFLIRHAERDKDDKIGTKDLNDNGRAQSIYLGEKLSSLNLEEFYYISTDVNRTLTTAILISRGMKETVLDSLTVTQNVNSNHFVKSDDFTVSWFQKNKDIDNCDGVKSWARFTKMAYDKKACPDAFYDVDEKVEEIVAKHFKYKDIHKFTLVSTHDNFLAPLLISVTDRKIGLNAHDYVTYNEKNEQNNWNQDVFKHWPNYLAGAAIIINEKDERTYVPVKGLKTGYLGEHCPNNENEDGLYSCKKWEKDVK